MDHRFIQNNLVAISISVFITTYTIIVLIKPHFLYNKDGSLREFGVGFKKKTVVPIWLVSILLGIISKLYKIQGTNTINAITIGNRIVQQKVIN